jgi:hypothetical protein
MAALRASIPMQRDDKDIAAALRAVETVLRKKAVQPVEAMTKRLDMIDARLEKLSRRFDGSSDRAAILPASEDPLASRRVSEALADLRRVLGES